MQLRCLEPAKWITDNLLFWLVEINSKALGGENRVRVPLQAFLKLC